MLAAIRAGRRVEHFETVRLARGGRLVPISLSVSPILNADGVVVGASKIARDISDRKRAEHQLTRATERDAFLAEATLTLTRSLDYEATLQSLARLAVPYLADYCAFDVIAEDGNTACVAATHVLPEKVNTADVLRELDDDETGLASPARVIRTRKGSLVRDVTDDIVAESARGDQERLERLRSLDLVAYMCVPMIAHDRTLGAMTLATSESGRHFSPEDVRRRSGPGDACRHGDRDRAVVPAAAKRESAEGRIPRDAVPRAANATERRARLRAHAAVGRYRRGESSAGAGGDRSQRRRRWRRSSRTCSTSRASSSARRG